MSPPRNYSRRVASVSLAILVLLFSTLGPVRVPIAPVLPNANAIQAATPAILGLFNEQRKSSAVIDSTLGTGALVKFDVNVTNAGLFKAFDIILNWTSTALTFSNSSFSGKACSSCLFNFSGASKLANQTSPSGYRLALADQCTTSCPPFVNGNGILFRIALKIQAASKSSVVHINTAVSYLQNPSSVPYLPIDGYFDNNNPPVFNYSMGISAVSATIIRPVSGVYPNGTLISPPVTNATSPATLSLTNAAGSAQSVVFRVLGLPAGASAQFTNPSCTPNCTSSLTITINGGPSTISTPSGTFSLAIIGNSTVTSGQMVKEVWFSLTVNPPKPPVYGLRSSPTATFTQEAGTFSLFTLNATLTSGANDTLAESSNCLLASITCTISPPSGSFSQSTPHSFFSTLNVTSAPDTPTGTRKFNITATTTGTYSEKPVQVFLTYTITIIRTHDLKVIVEGAARGFGFAGVSLAAHPIIVNTTVVNAGTVTETFTVNGTAKTVLKIDPKLMFVDANNNGLWNPGESVVYDTNGNGIWDPGTDPIVANSTIIPNGAPLSQDPNIKFVDSNFDNLWNPGEAVANDANGNGLYDTGEAVIAGSAPSPGSLISTQLVANLAAGASIKVALNFDPGSLPRGNYMVSVAAVPVAGELLVSNNALTIVAFVQRLKGDVNGDCKVDIVDLVTVGSLFGKNSSQAGFNPHADLNNDGIIDIIDLVLVAGSFGQHC